MLLILAIIALLVCEVVLFSLDRYITSFFLLIGSFAAAFFLIDGVSQYVTDVGWWTLVSTYGLYYLGGGVAVATLKWFQQLYHVRHTISDLRVEFEQSYKAPTSATAVTSEQSIPGVDVGRPVPLTEAQLRMHKRKAFIRFVTSNRPDALRRTQVAVPSDSATVENVLSSEEGLIDILTPKARNNVERISFWVLQWPIVVLSTVLEDLLLKIGKHLARLFDAVFNRAARALVGGAVEGM
jgi:hypothetical protein